MRMDDYSKVFPMKVNMDRYQPLIEAALKAAKGVDNLPRVVIEDFETAREAVKAANAIRNHCRANNLKVAVSCPENGHSIRVYRSEKPRRTRTSKKKDADALATDAASNEVLES